MSKNLTVKYPREKIARHGVNRSWLLDHLAGAKYPRLALALITAIKDPWQIAAEALVTEDILIDTVFGRDDLTPHEWNAVCFALRGPDDLPPAPSWLQAADIEYESEADACELRENALAALKTIPARHPVKALCSRLLNMHPAPYEALIFPLYFADSDPEFVRRCTTPKTRRSPLPHSENTEAPAIVAGALIMPIKIQMPSRYRRVIPSSPIYDGVHLCASAPAT